MKNMKLVLCTIFAYTMIQKTLAENGPALEPISVALNSFKETTAHHSPFALPLIRDIEQLVQKNCAFLNDEISDTKDLSNCDGVTQLLLFYMNAYRTFFKKETALMNNLTREILDNQATFAIDMRHAIDDISLIIASDALDKEEQVNRYLSSKFDSIQEEDPTTHGLN